MKLSVYLSIFIVYGVSYSTLAQNIVPINITRVDAKSAIDSLRNARYVFNKNLIKNRTPDLNQLPKSGYLFNKAGEYVILFNGIKFLFKDSNLISITGVSASPTTLAIINEKLLTLDRFQAFYSVKSNQEYSNPYRNLHDIYNSDRQFFSSLRILDTTLRDIAKLVKRNTSKIEFEMGLAKMRLPNLPFDTLDKEFQAASVSVKI